MSSIKVISQTLLHPSIQDRHGESGAGSRRLLESTFCQGDTEGAGSV